jgi:diguanylate cyclase (GGDEF)-like protein
VGGGKTPRPWRLVGFFKKVVTLVSLIGFCGSRSLSASATPLVAGVVSSVFSSGRSVAVGCCVGAGACVLRAVHLAEEAMRVRRGGEVLTVGVVDVNKFKYINDTYGHQVGDACIQHVADVIRRNIRQGDWLARWGGDEFVLVLRDASPFARTEALLQWIVKDLKNSPVRLPRGEELRLSVTVGTSRYSGAEDLRDLLAKADEAMYKAKREGRSLILSA